jgi:hypothetical protein
MFAVHPDALSTWWPVMGPWIMAAMARGFDGGICEPDILARINARHYLLIGVAETAEVVNGAFLMELDPRRGVLWLSACGARRGSLKRLGPSMFAECVRIARDQGMAKIRVVGRRGWARFLAEQSGQKPKVAQIIYEVKI